jgi:hypothetical protein
MIEKGNSTNNKGNCSGKVHFPSVEKGNSWKIGK